MAGSTSTSTRAATGSLSRAHLGRRTASGLRSLSAAAAELTGWEDSTRKGGNLVEYADEDPAIGKFSCRTQEERC